MKEIFMSFIEASKDRIKNPVIGTFAISWFAFNWKSIFILFFSEKIIEDRISHIDKNYMSLDALVWYPIILTVCYIIVLPYLMSFFELILVKANVYRRKLLSTKQVYDLKSKADVIREELALENIRAQHMDKEKLNDFIEKLKTQNADLKTLNDEQKAKIEKLKEGSGDLQLSKEFEFQKAYEKFKEESIFASFEQVGYSIKTDEDFPKKMTQLEIEKYLAHGIVEYLDVEDNQVDYYKFTEKGNDFWKRFILEKDL